MCPTAGSLPDAREDLAGTAAGAPRDGRVDAGERTRGRRIVIRPAGAAWTGLGDQLRALPEYRDLLVTLSAHRINVRYRQTALGVLWAVLQPLLMMLIFTGVFSVLARIPG